MFSFAQHLVNCHSNHVGVQCLCAVDLSSHCLTARGDSHLCNTCTVIYHNLYHLAPAGPFSLAQARPIDALHRTSIYNYIDSAAVDLTSVGL